MTPETAESATILVKPGRDWAGHVPGQYVRVGVDVDGVRLWRTYSLTHGPRRDRNLSFTVKAIPGGVVSNHLVHRARAGQMLQLEQAEGEFVLPTPIPRKLLLVTAGSGITPVIGMLRNLFSRRVPGRHRHHARARQPERVVRDLPRRAPGARHRRPPPPGRAVRRQPRHPRRRPPRRARARPGRAAHLRLRAGRPARRPREAPRRPRPLAHHRAVPPRRSSSAGEGGTVTFADGREVEADGATPILDAAEGAGVLMPSGCRMGICMGCVIPHEVRRGPRPAQRRHHRRRPRRDRPGGRHDPDLHQRCCWCLPHR